MSRMTCVMCGRLTVPFAFIGQSAVGPTCAAKHNIKPKKMQKGAKVLFAKIKAVREKVPQTMDLFDDADQTQD